MTDLIQEYFSSGDQAEALTALEEAAEPELHHYFVKKLLTMSLDKHDHEREMASMLLSALYSEVRPHFGLCSHDWHVTMLQSCAMLSQYRTCPKGSPPTMLIFVRGEPEKPIFIINLRGEPIKMGFIIVFQGGEPMTMDSVIKFSWG